MWALHARLSPVIYTGMRMGGSGSDDNVATLLVNGTRAVRDAAPETQSTRAQRDVPLRMLRETLRDAMRGPATTCEDAKQ